MTETDLTFRIGSTVRCHDGKCGELEKVVIDPHTRRITALVVAKGLLFPDKRVVPVSIVQETDPDVVLDMDADELAELPAYEARVYKEPPEGWEITTHIPTSDMIMPVMPWTVVQRKTLRPIIRYQVHEGVPQENVVVERGTQVECVDGVIGKVDHLLITSDTGEFTHLVVDRGPLATRLIVPREMIGALGETLIRLEATKEELEELHCVHAREDEDIEAEFLERLSDIPLDPDSIDVEVEGGLVHVSGTVADIATKRHVEGLARAVEGVVAVKNDLYGHIAAGECGPGVGQRSSHRPGGYRCRHAGKRRDAGRQGRRRYRRQGRRADRQAARGRHRGDQRAGGGPRRGYRRVGAATLCLGGYGWRQRRRPRHDRRRDPRSCVGILVDAHGQPREVRRKPGLFFFWELAHRRLPWPSRCPTMGMSRPMSHNGDLTSDDTLP